MLHTSAFWDGAEHNWNSNSKNALLESRVCVYKYVTHVCQICATDEVASYVYCCQLIAVLTFAGSSLCPVASFS